MVLVEFLKTTAHIRFAHRNVMKSSYAAITGGYRRRIGRAAYG
jgi:hypothetical protein